MKRNRVLIILAAALAVFASFGLGACMPNGWEHIIAAPEAVTDVTIVGTADVSTENMGITVAYTVPTFSIFNLPYDASKTPGPVYYIRIATASLADSILLGESTNLLQNKSGQTLEDSISVSKADLINGASYIFTVYTVDGEGQFSAPAESAAFVVSW